MSKTNLIIKAAIGTVFIMALISIFIFFAGGAVRIFADGRVTQAEDAEYADNECANLKTSKGFRVNGEECNKARARKDLPTTWLFLYDSWDFFSDAISAIKAIVVKNLLLILFAITIIFGITFYNYRFLYSLAMSLIPQKEKFT